MRDQIKASESRRVTLLDVAKHVGVSKSTVSLVLRRSDDVNEKTRERVLKGIEQTGYVYNRQAADLRQTRTSDLLGIIINGLNTPYAGELLHHFEQHTMSMDLIPMFASHSDRLKQQDRLVRNYMEYNVNGLVICPAPSTPASWLDRLWRNGFPLVQIMREVPFGDFPAVVASNRSGTYAATQHLIQLGHSKIAFIGGLDTLSDYHERLGGFMDATGEAGLSVPTDYIFQKDQDREAGREGLKTLLAYDPQITAIVCFSDLMAYGVLSEAREMGIEVGKDLAVVGFDDIADSRLTNPALTTVAVSAAEIAKAAIELLQVYTRDRNAPRQRIVIPATLTIRESCGANSRH